jgi:3',5'-cyclic AMP phosphodiesterase CpdA
MIIAQISDTHIASDAPDADQRILDFERTIADINALAPAPDVIVHTGDIVHNGRADEYACARRILGNALAPVYVLIGNKDDRTNLRAAFAPQGYLPANSEFIDYAVERFPVRLIAVDTLSIGNNKGDFCREREKRLVAMIDAEDTKPIAAFTHHPPFEVKVGPDPINFETSQAMSRLADVLQHSGRVVGVFSGHVHRSTTGHVGRIPAVVATAIATPLRKGDYPAQMKSRAVYYLHRFDPLWGFVTETRIVRQDPAQNCERLAVSALQQPQRR